MLPADLPEGYHTLEVTVGGKTEIATVISAPEKIELLDDMKETLADANGYGLAGPQVGVMRRVFISIDERDIPEGQEDTAPLKFIEFVNPEILEEMPLRLQCDCSREYIERVLLSMGENEIRDMIEKQNGCEVECHFCRKHYRFSGEELEALLAQANKENGGDE